MPDFNEQDYDRDRKRKKREDSSVVQWDNCKNPRRRRRCEKDVFKFLKTYFPGKFWAPFSPDQREMVAAILHRAKYGGDQAIAAPRGGGKTTITECVIIYALLTGLVRFPVIVGANSDDARSRLENIKSELESNDLLAEDYPELCMPIRDVATAPQRGRKQLGRDRQPTRIEWSAHNAVFPMVKSTMPKEQAKWQAAAGARLETRGLDAAIRGINRRGMRPDFVLLDDPETRESADSEYQTELRERTIDRDIAGLAGKGKRLARVALCTIQNRKCLAYRLTDRRIKPSWQGKRYRLVEQWPTNAELWDEYMGLRRQGHESGEDPDARKAHAFYVARRAAMDEGAVMGNEYVQDTAVLPDGSPIEVSSLQHCYNLVCDLGMDAFLTEHQNDPPEEDGPQTSGISATLVESRINGWPRRLVPRQTEFLVAAMDLGKYACHWTVQAWLPNAVGFVVDYGVHEVVGMGKGDDRQAVSRALYQALLSWRDELLSHPFQDDGGTQRELNMVMVDSGDHNDAVYQFLIDVGGAPFCASKGTGEHQFRDRPDDPGKRRRGPGKPSGHSYAERQDNGVWLYMLDTNYWKHWVHDRFLTPTFNQDRTYRPGSLSLYQSLKVSDHHSFAHHIAAEQWVEEWKEAKGWKKFWKPVGRNNHWLDANYMACAAADWLGVRVVGDRPVVRQATRIAPPPITNPAGLPYMLTQRNG